MATDHREISEDKGFDQLDNMLPRDFGKIVYALAFNEQGKEIVVTRKCRRADDLPAENIEDEVWRITNEALALKRNQDSVAKGGSTINYSSILIGKTQDQDTLTVSVLRTECCDDERCPPREFCILKPR